ncbi:MAG: hypothetical protein U9O82_03745 [Thermodesulfobacteriota bacterium]|nr:hypothetical protein [Thermodesulfobacteriota bacterium]
MDSILLTVSFPDKEIITKALNYHFDTTGYAMLYCSFIRSDCWLKKITHGIFNHGALFP